MIATMMGGRAVLPGPVRKGIRSCACLALLLAVLLGFAANADAAITVTRTSGTNFYTDTSTTSPGVPKCGYVSFIVSTSTAIADVWATIGSFSGGYFSLGGGDTGVFHFGPMAAGQSKPLFFYLCSSYTTLSSSSTQTYSITKTADKTSANPGEVITYTVQVGNTGAGPGTSVVLTDSLSPYTALFFGSGTPFTFTDSVPVSGLNLGTVQYSSTGGKSWGNGLISGAGGAPAGYDGAVTNWKIPMTGTIRQGGSFTLKYQVIVK